MPKNPESAAAAENPAVSEPISLEEFCRRQSEHDKRVSLIAGFYHDQKANGDAFSTITTYRAKYADYITRPIN